MELSSSVTHVRIASPDGIETRTYKVEGPVGNLDKLEALFHWINSCCSAGHSAEAVIFVDGDGSARMKFGGLKEENKEKGQLSEDSYSDPEFRVGFD